MNIRPATIADEPSFREMYFAYLKEMEQYGYDILPTQGYVDQYWNNTFLPAIVTGDPILVSEEDGVTVGFIAITAGESSKIAFNRGVYVKPEFRRRGIASGLFKSGLARCLERGVSRLFDMASVDNGPAASLLSKLGHKPTAFCYSITP